MGFLGSWGLRVWGGRRHWPKASEFVNLACNPARQAPAPTTVRELAKCSYCATINTPPATARTPVRCKRASMPKQPYECWCRVVVRQPERMPARAIVHAACKNETANALATMCRMGVPCQDGCPLKHLSTPWHGHVCTHAENVSKPMYLTVDGQNLAPLSLSAFSPPFHPRF